RGGLHIAHDPQKKQHSPCRVRRSPFPAACDASSSHDRGARALWSRNEIGLRSPSREGGAANTGVSRPLTPTLAAGAGEEPSRVLCVKRERARPPPPARGRSREGAGGR